MEEVKLIISLTKNPSNLGQIEDMKIF
jgi:hypothetical protein